LCASRRGVWGKLGMVIACAACASNTAPKGWLLTPTEALSTAYGGWIELTHIDSADQRSQGELIAVSADSVWVLVGNQAIVIPTARVRDGKLTAYVAQKGNLATWTAVGALATLSNGGFLLFTAPMWIIGGSLVVGAESRAPERKAPPLTWAELAPFARFPQGIPPGLELTSLQPRKDVIR
jgi:hypothetical protein